MDSQIVVRLLGHLEVEVSGERVRFEGVRQRRLFAMLALHAPEAVSTDELVEALWGERLPAGGVQALQKQISRLRQRLGAGGSLVRHRPPGYALDIDPWAIDSRRFEELLRRARVALGGDDPQRAVADLQAALALWRGEPLADYRFDEFAQREIARLEELGLEAIEERLAAELALGGAEGLVGELQALVAEHPLRERLRGQLMVALYRLCALGRRAVLVADADAVALCNAAVAAARKAGDPNLIADALLTSAGACERTHAWERADALAGEALQLYRRAGDAYGAAWALAEQGWYDMVHGRLDESEQCLEEALELHRRHGDDRRLVEPLIDYAWLLLARSHNEGAKRGFLDCLALARHVGDQFIVGEALAGLSTHAALERRWSDAARLAGASAAVHEQIGAPPWESVTAIQDRALAGAREALGSRYTAEFAQGQRLSAEQAIAATPHHPAPVAASGAR